jgi:putative membrane protein
MHTIISLLLSTLAVIVTAYILPGVHVKNFLSAFVAAVILGVANSLLLPLLLIITLPINILTLGLFTIVIIGLLVLGVSAIVPGFEVNGFWWAVAFAIVLAIVNAFVHSFSK